LAARPTVSRQLQARQQRGADILQIGQDPPKIFKLGSGTHSQAHANFQLGNLLIAVGDHALDAIMAFGSPGKAAFLRQKQLLQEVSRARPLFLLEFFQIGGNVAFSQKAFHSVHVRPANMRN
jgi:hypothetical protein